MGQPPTNDSPDASNESEAGNAAVTGADSAGQVLEALSYLGVGAIVQQTRPQTGVDLSLIQQNGDTLTSSDGGDRYTGLNRFDEVIDQNWVNPNTVTSTDRFQYSYDPNGNVLDKDNLVHAADSELYHTSSTTMGDIATAYDPLNRLTAFIRGTLISSGNNGSSLDKIANSSINTAAASDETWSLDALGNWTASGTAAGTGTGTAPTLTSTGRTNNSQNEVTVIGAHNLTYDNDGRMLTDVADGYEYDAWGDEMSSACVTGPSYPIEDYAYDAMGRPISETTYTSSACSTTRNLYYSQAGQVTDDIHAGPSTCTTGAFYECVCGCSCCCVCYCCSTTSMIDDQQVNGAGYVDELVLRDETTSTTTTYSDTTGFNYVTTTPSTTRLYVQQDANYNVTALTSTSGTVDERFLYDPYGNQQVLTASWTSTTDAYNWLYGFQGGRTDVAVSGLVTFGARDYSASDGRWVAPDPIGYGDGMDDYQTDDANPATYIDPLGTKSFTVKNGTFDFNMTLTQNTLQTNAGMNGTISFTPNKDVCPKCNDIGIVQISRVRSKGEEYDWTKVEGEGNRNKIRTGEDKAAGVLPGWFVDHFAGQVAPGKGASLYYRDYIAKTEKTYKDNFDGSKVDGKDPSAAQIWDAADTDGAGHLIFEYETVAVCKDTGAVLGAITWGFSIEKNSDQAVALDPKATDAASATYTAAVSKFNQFYGNPEK